MQDPPKVTLCVGVVSAHSSASRGGTADWTVTAWTTGGNIPDAIIRLQASAASVSPQFSFGCGSSDGSTACNLGAMDAKSAERQLQAQVKVPATATMKSIRLTAIGSAAHLPTDPAASASVAITGAVIPAATTSPLPIGTLPAVSTPSPTLTPGGNASGLFPTVAPSPSTSGGKKVTTRPVADTAAMPQGASVVGAQLVGLGALAVAFVLAVTRLSIRRRPSLATGVAAQSGTPGTPSGAPDAQPETPGTDNGASAASDDSGDSTPEP